MFLYSLYWQRFSACSQMSLLSSKGGVHARMVGVRPVLVWQRKGAGLTSVYYVVVRTITRWTFWPPPGGLLIDAAFFVRKR